MILTGNTAGGEMHTREIDVVIDVGDVNEHAPELGALQIDANAPSAMADDRSANLLIMGDDITAMLGSGITTLAGATSGDDSALDGTTADEWIYGDDGDDNITSGGGADHIIGGAGDDFINLDSTAGSIETIYYRFTSTDSGAWTTTDGTDTIRNFRRGEDKLVFLNADGSVIDLATFTDHDNLAIQALWSGGENLIGVEILFGTTKILEIRYHASSYVPVYTLSGNTWDHAATNRYIGAIAEADVSSATPAGYTSSTRNIATTTLLPNYFNAVGADVLISEKYTSAHGVFANLPASDADGTSPNNAITSYDITGGTGANHFVLADDGDISVKAGATLDAAEYTLIITASDGGDTPMTSDPKTITIGILEDSLAEYSLVQPNGQIAVMLDTADADGVTGTPSYQWFRINTDGTRTNVGTDTTTYTPPTDDADLVHGVTITYTDTFDDAAGTQTTVEALTTPIKITDADGDIVPSYTAPVGEAEDPDDNTIIIDVDASVENAPDGHVIGYKFRRGDNDFHFNDPSNTFAINDDGEIRLALGATLDFETTPSYTLTVSVAYDADGMVGTDDQAHRDVQVIINVQDVNEHAPAFAPLEIVENLGAVAGIPVAALAGLTGTAAAEHITGTTGDDTTITSGGGADHIFGDAGTDTIRLDAAAGSVETVYYRLSSAGSGAWVGSDGIDTIENFRRGEDRVVFIDTDGSPISRTDFLNNGNRGASGGQLTVKLLTTETMPTAGATVTTVNGIEIQFDANNKLVLKYHSDTTPSFARASTGAYTGSEADFIGRKGVGFDSTTKTLTNHGLLANYFNVNSGDDNLQVMGDDILTRLGADIAISEKYTNAHGVFAKLPASDADGSAPNNAITYDILAGSTGRGVFVIDDGDISVKAGMTLDATEYTLIIQASDGANMTSPAKTITIGILEDSLAEYSISESSGELTVARISEDLDGVDGTPSYQWFKIETDGTRTNIGTDTTTYTPPMDDMDLIHGVTITYTDTLDVAAGTQTTVEALTTPIKLTDADGDIVPSYTIPVSEDAADSSEVYTINASVDGASADSTLTYAFRLPNGSFNAFEPSGIFTIDSDGVISVLDGSGLDYESATQSYTLTVNVLYDADGDASDKSDQESRDVQVIINVQDVNEFAPAFAPLAIVADSGAVAGIPGVTELTGLTGMAAAEHITGTTGMDTITSGGGADHIFGGAGNDEITLSTDANNVETVYYRFASTDGGWTSPDGTDEIHNFRRGEDRVVFIDTDGSVIDLKTFLNNGNVGTSGGQLTVKLLATETPSSGVTQVTITGIEIQFDANNKLVLNYHSDITFSYNSTTGSPSATGLPFIGTNGAGYDSTTKTLTNHADLLANYFGDTGNTNLQVIGEADSPNFGGDILISERRRHEDGVFATLAATDDDGAPNNAVSYKITGGTGMDIFAIDEHGGIRVASGKGFNTEGGTEALTYTLTIEASDSADTPMKATETITIGVEVDHLSVYGFFVNTALELEASLDTADSDGVVESSVRYQWFSTDGTSINLFGAPSDSNTFDRSSNPLPANSVYGVSVTYEDQAGNMEVFTTVSGLIDGGVADETLNGHANSTNFIVGGLGVDTIDGKGGTAHIWGGEGNDIIKLTEAKGSVETIYYAFSSTDGAWTTTDGFDTITNFRRDEDRLIFVDEDESLITMTEFLNHDNLAIRTIEGGLGETLQGVEIFFGTTKILEINYHADSYERFLNNGPPWDLEVAEKYLGDIPGDDVNNNNPTGYDFDTLEVATTTLLPNYFNEETGQDNLQIHDDEMIVIVDLI